MTTITAHTGSKVAQNYRIAKQYFIRKRFQRTLDLSLHNLELFLQQTQKSGGYHGNDGNDNRYSAGEGAGGSLNVTWDVLSDRLQSMRQILTEMTAVKHNSERSELHHVEAHVMLIVQSLYEMNKRLEACKVIPLCFGSVCTAPPALRRVQIDLLSAVGDLGDVGNEVRDLEKGVESGVIDRSDVERMKTRIKDRMKRKQEREKKRQQQEQLALEQESNLRGFLQRNRESIMKTPWREQQEQQQDVSQHHGASSSISEKSLSSKNTREETVGDRDLWQRLIDVLLYVVHIFSYNVRVWLLILLCIVIMVLLHGAPTDGIVSRFKNSILELARVAFLLN